jgi:tetratricopeptide (TPR) repeat protein
MAAIATNRIELWALWQPEQAVRNAPDAITVNRCVNRRLEIGKCQTAVAQALLALGSEVAALHELDQAIQILEEVGYRSGRARALLTRAFAHSQLEDSETAAQDLELAVTELCATDVYPTLVMQAEFLATHLGLDLPLVKMAAERARRRIQPLTNFGDLERHLEGTINSLLRIRASG